MRERLATLGVGLQNKDKWETHDSRPFSLRRAEIKAGRNISGDNTVRAVTGDEEGEQEGAFELKR